MKKKVILIFILAILIIGIITGINETDYIVQSFKNAFNIDVDPILEKQWDIRYLSYEEGITTNIQPIDENNIEINITNVNGGGYKFDSATCNISNVDSIEKFEYNPVTEVWTSTGNLQHDLLTNYGMPAGWCSETNGYGFVLFTSTSQNKSLRLRFPEGEKRIILITGTNSEKVNISYSNTVEINNVAFVKFTVNETGRNDTITMVTHASNLR